jgi:hypothetical protein
MNARRARKIRRRHLRRLRVIAGGWGSVTNPPRAQSRFRVLEGLGHARPHMPRHAGPVA